jgi:hypothetical protein
MPASRRQKDKRAGQLQRRARLADTVAPAVVQVQVSGWCASSLSTGEDTANLASFRVIGSGIIVDPSGYIITNELVVRNEQSIRVMLTPKADHAADAPMEGSALHPGSALLCVREQAESVSLSDRSDLDTASIGCRFLARQERRVDIPSLTRYFVQKLAQRMSRNIETIPTSALDALTRYDWQYPRTVETSRSLMLTNGRTLHVATPELMEAAAARFVA